MGNKTLQRIAWLRQQKVTDIKLTNVARANLEELLMDYEDFLCTQKLPIWGKEHRLLARLREINRSAPKPTYETFKKIIEHESFQKQNLN